MVDSEDGATSRTLRDCTLSQQHAWGVVVRSKSRPSSFQKRQTHKKNIHDVIRDVPRWPVVSTTTRRAHCMLVSYGIVPGVWVRRWVDGIHVQARLVRDAIGVQVE